MASGRQLVDPNQEQNDAALALAEATAEGDQRRTIELFTAFINIVDRARAAPKAGIAELTRLIAQEGVRTRPIERRGSRQRGRARAASTGPSIYSDPTFIRNARELIQRRARIVGGVPTVQFRDCVAIGSGRRWCCTGTLVAPNVVVSAAHCSDGCAARVFIGTDVKKPASGRVVRVRKAVVHPKYGTAGDHYDLMVLVLDERVNVTPRRIAGRAALARAKSVRVVGFGATDFQGRRGYGLRRVVDVPMAAPKSAFGARASIEFVAGAPFLDRDSCNGDSGGPAYVAVKGGWAVAGATSRATNSAQRNCGDGGIYTKLHAFNDWIRSVPGGNWKA